MHSTDYVQAPYWIELIKVHDTYRVFVCILYVCSE